MNILKLFRNYRRLEERLEQAEKSLECSEQQIRQFLYSPMAQEKLNFSPWPNLYYSTAYRRITELIKDLYSPMAQEKLNFSPWPNLYYSTASRQMTELIKDLTNQWEEKQLELKIQKIIQKSKDEA